MINIGLVYFVQNGDVFLDDPYFVCLLRQGTQIRMLFKLIFVFSENSFSEKQLFYYFYTYA
jgi:hypothetical protein